jgi:hypothetical protein
METKNNKILFWSMEPGNFVNIQTGERASNDAKQKFVFEGTVRTWFETFVEMIETAVSFYDISKSKMTIEIACSPYVLNILKHCVSYFPYYNDKEATGEFVGILKGIGKVSLNEKIPYNQCNVYLLNENDKDIMIIDKVEIRVLDMPID